MMNGNKLTRNAIMAVIQVFVSGVTLFLLYRYLLSTIGTEQVGIWAIVLAATSASRVGEMGFSASAVKYTASYIARGDKNKASEVIQTTIITIGVVLACILLFGYQPIAWLMAKAIPSTHFSTVLTILPYTLVSVWLGAISGAFLSGLDGCQRVDLRSLLSMLAAIFLLVATWILVPQYGLTGLVLAQIGQGLLVTIGGLTLLRRELPSLPLLSFSWSYSLFREMLNYGLNFQVISIFLMVIDPITKILMAKFGGLTSVAYYEMANRMVTQFRSLLVSANQVMVPHVAELYENSPEKIQKAYLDSYRIVFFLSLPLFAGVAAIAPLASELWIGQFEYSFVIYTIILSSANYLNTLTTPAYFVNLGTGFLRWNTWAHVVMAIINIILGYMLGVILGGEGVALGYALALIICSSIIILAHHSDAGIPFSVLLPSESKQLLISCCTGLLVGWGAFHFFITNQTPLIKAGVVMMIYAIIIIPAFIVHPLRKKISGRLLAVFQF